ncbi:MAG TPA: rhomboid family intramembrane serine protease [Myxococcales bacterium]|nr:rhomboid family intramembrane serine protease [Myxococcales bacterium]
MAATGALSIAGVPWATIALLLACAWLLVLAGGLRSGLGLSSLLLYGAKATPLILDRGETWRLFAANLLHKDPLHLAFNAFALWNVGGALERAVRPADYVALLVFTALGTTLVSALGSDSISLGASGIAFGMLGAAATFGWRRGVRGSLRSYFGLRIVPWLLALFAAGLGSAGVDNWGHFGGLISGAVLGAFMTPRHWPGEAAARRLAAAAGALLGTLALGVVAAPALPALGPVREGPAGLEAKIPLGWRRAGVTPTAVSYTNGLTGTFRRSATLVQSATCKGRGCGCDRLVRSAIEDELWRLADVGALRHLQLGAEGVARGVPGATRIDGTIDAADGQAEVSALCMQRGSGDVALIVLQPVGGSKSLVERMGVTVETKK